MFIYMFYVWNIYKKITKIFLSLCCISLWTIFRCLCGVIRKIYFLCSMYGIQKPQRFHKHCVVSLYEVYFYGKFFYGKVLWFLCICRVEVKRNIYIYSLKTPNIGVKTYSSGSWVIICNYVTCYFFFSKIYILYVQEVVTRPKLLNRTILSNWIHVT